MTFFNFFLPQAKGRIERLWQTLQGRFPHIFRFFGIKTVRAANGFLPGFIADFNARFAVEAQSPSPAWREPPAADYDLLFSVRADKRSDAQGFFIIYHGFRFRIPAPRLQFSLCLSERGGIRARAGNKWLPVTLAEPLLDTVNPSMPEVEKELVRRCLLADTHSVSAAG